MSLALFFFELEKEISWIWCQEYFRERIKASEPSTGLGRCWWKPQISVGDPERGWPQTIGDCVPCMWHPRKWRSHRWLGHSLGPRGSLLEPWHPSWYKKNPQRSCAPWKGKEGLREAQGGAGEDAACMHIYLNLTRLTSLPSGERGLRYIDLYKINVKPWQSKTEVIKFEWLFQFCWA